MRYILYTDKFYDVGPLKNNTHIQFLNKLSRIPDWMNDKPKPILVDKVKEEAWAGEEALALFKPKKVVVEDD
jgi:hypothetical protein